MLKIVLVRCLVFVCVGVESDLTRLMKIRKLRSKSEAIQSPSVSYSDWIGIASAGQNRQPRFQNHSDLWA